jgi:hypothetical protein
VQGQVERVDPGMGMAEPARGLAVAQPGGDPGADRGVGRGGVGVEPGQRIGRGTERAEQRLEVVGSAAGATRVASGAGRAVQPPALPGPVVMRRVPAPRRWRRWPESRCRVLWIMGLGCRRYQSVGVFEVHETVFWIMRNCLQDRANLP